MLPKSGKHGPTPWCSKYNCGAQIRFLEEARLMYGLRHRNILPLLAINSDVPALLSGFSEHGDLYDCLRRRVICEKCPVDGFISYE